MILRRNLACPQISSFKQLSHERLYLAVFWRGPCFIDESARAWAAKVKFGVQVFFGAVVVLDRGNDLRASVRLADSWTRRFKFEDRVSDLLNRTFGKTFLELAGIVQIRHWPFGYRL